MALLRVVRHQLLDLAKRPLRPRCAPRCQELRIPRQQEAAQGGLLVDNQALRLVGTRDHLITMVDQARPIAHPNDLIAE
jgi:hypothetical protein